MNVKHMSRKNYKPLKAKKNILYIFFFIFDEPYLQIENKKHKPMNKDSMTDLIITATTRKRKLPTTAELEEIQRAKGYIHDVLGTTFGYTSSEYTRAMEYFDLYMLANKGFKHSYLSQKYYSIDTE